MGTVEIDRTPAGTFQVGWMQGFQPLKTRTFSSRQEAEVFAQQKMGKTGYIISTLDMTDTQLAANNVRKTRKA